jgi:type VI secretion system secreted protein VgrG
MPKFSQANRPIRVDTVLGADVLLLERFTGEERVSAPFRFQLGMLSEETSIDAKKVLGTAAYVTLELPEGGERVIHGRISRFAQLGRDETGLTAYQAELVPWLWFLSLSSDCRVYQNLSVLEIVEQVFGDKQFSSLKPEFQSKCLKSYPKREYCVQYRESHLNFVSRLLEEEGIFYYFDHSESKHTLMLTDSSSTLKSCPGDHALRMAPTSTEGVHDRNVALAITAEVAASTGEIHLRDYNPLLPSTDLSAQTTCTSPFGVAFVLDYPGRYAAKDEAERYAALRAETVEAPLMIVHGTSNGPALQSGARFDLTEHYRRDLNRTYQVLEVRHEGQVGNYRHADDDTFTYSNEFVAIPDNVKYHPPLATPKPVVHGSQTAVVVGKAGEEIWVDKHGRVKVQFFWDAYGKKNETSSCWVRVSTAWAGKGWGVIQIPRIGQEVIVDFLEGDPDRPIITGRVYNADQTPPYALPDNQTQSGVKTRSSKGGGADNANEIRFEDKKGSEQLYAHAEKDLLVEVENDETRDVQHDRTTTIKNNETKTISEGNEVIAIKKGDQTLTIDMGKQEITLGQGNQVVTLKQGNQTIELDMGNQSTTAKLGNITTKASVGKIEMEAMQSLTLKVGQNSITIDQSGVKINGMTVKVEGQIQTQVKGPITQVNGDAMLQLKGGIAMIN